MKKTLFGKIFATLTLTVLLASTVTATAFAKTIPEEYREFTRYESFYYHTLTVTTNYDTKIGEVVKIKKSAAGIEPFEAYYVSVGNRTLNGCIAR